MRQGSPDSSFGNIYFPVNSRLFYFETVIFTLRQDYSIVLDSK